jgi:hypothetical protein
MATDPQATEDIAAKYMARYKYVWTVELVCKLIVRVEARTPCSDISQHAICLLGAIIATDGMADALIPQQRVWEILYLINKGPVFRDTDLWCDDGECAAVLGTEEVDEDEDTETWHEVCETSDTTSGGAREDTGEAHGANEATGDEAVEALEAPAVTSEEEAGETPEAGEEEEAVETPAADEEGAVETPETGEEEAGDAPETGEEEDGEAPETGEEEDGEAPETGEEEDGEAPETGEEEDGEAPETGEEEAGEAPETGEDEAGEAFETGEEEDGEAPETGEDEAGEASETGEEETGEASETGEEETGEVPETGEEETGEAPETGEEETGEAPETGEASETGEEETGEVPETGDPPVYPVYVQNHILTDSNAAHTLGFEDELHELAESIDSTGVHSLTHTTSHTTDYNFEADLAYMLDSA